jgi:ABC-type sulfate transport system permease component
MVKQGDQWLLASFQFAPSIFDNPLLTKATSMTYFACAGAAVIGLLLGLWIGRISGKKRAAA